MSYQLQKLFTLMLHHFLPKNLIFVPILESYVDSSTYSLSGIEPVTRSSLSDSDSLTARARGPFLPSDRQLSLLRLLALALLWHSL